MFIHQYIRISHMFSRSVYLSRSPSVPAPGCRYKIYWFSYCANIINSRIATFSLLSILFSRSHSDNGYGSQWWCAKNYECEHLSGLSLTIDSIVSLFLIAICDEFIFPITLQGAKSYYQWVFINIDIKSRILWRHNDEIWAAVDFSSW